MNLHRTLYVAVRSLYVAVRSANVRFLVLLHRLRSSVVRRSFAERRPRKAGLPAGVGRLSLRESVLHAEWLNA